MKWFKHDCDASEDPKIQKLKNKFGMEGYGIYFNLLEFIGRKMENDISSFGFLPDDWDNEALEIEFGQNSDKIKTIIDYMCQIGLFEKINNKLYNKKIKERCDDYTNRLLRLKQFTGTNSEHSSDSVRTKSDFVPPRLDKIRLDKIRLEREPPPIRKKKKHPLLEEDMTPKDLEEFKGKFPTCNIDFEWEKVKDWLAANGVEKVDYKAFFRNWLRGAVPKKKGIVVIRP